MGSFAAALAMLALGSGLVAAAYAAHRGTAIASTSVLVGPFLSGLAPAEHAVSRFHARWYALTLVFLAFDVEMLFMYPWAVVVVEMGAKAIVEMFVFLGLLLAAVVYAWREGALQWS